MTQNTIKRIGNAQRTLCFGKVVETDWVPVCDIYCVYVFIIYVYTHGFEKMLEMIWVPYLVSKVEDIKDRHVR